jgi:hypothetical protein
LVTDESEEHKGPAASDDVDEGGGGSDDDNDAPSYMLSPAGDEYDRDNQRGRDAAAAATRSGNDFSPDMSCRLCQLFNDCCVVSRCVQPHVYHIHGNIQL